VLEGELARRRASMVELPPVFARPAETLADLKRRLLSEVGLWFAGPPGALLPTLPQHPCPTYPHSGYSHSPQPSTPPSPMHTTPQGLLRSTSSDLSALIGPGAPGVRVQKPDVRGVHACAPRDDLHVTIRQLNEDMLPGAVLR
jgi:hypothetical protein